ncbi:MAG: response regulator [Deltaproteobacteria bacterium]|nr:response regulator [Deltaproteobacteria bacterium]
MLQSELEREYRFLEERVNRVLRATRRINKLLVYDHNPKDLLLNLCNILVETGAYHAAWIIVSNDNSQPLQWAQSGWNETFTPIHQFLSSGKWPLCYDCTTNSNSEFSFNSNIACHDCPLSQKNTGHQAVIVRLMYREKFLGLLSVSIPENNPFSDREATLYNEVTDDIVSILWSIKLENKQKEAETRLRIFAEALAASSDGIGVATPEGKHWYQNQALTDLLGDIGESPPQTVYLEPQVGHEVFAAIMAGNTWTGEVRMKGRTIDVVNVWLRAYPLKDEHGKIIALVGVHSDITERKLLQARVAQTDRLATMGMLAAGVAHEINNPLTYVIFNLETINRDIHKLIACCKKYMPHIHSQFSLDDSNLNQDLSIDLESFHSRLKDALTGSHRIADIVKSLRIFSRAKKYNLNPISISDILDTAANMTTNEMKYRCKLIKSYQEVPQLIADEGKLSQVFINLLINAAQAIEEGNAANNEIQISTWHTNEKIFVEIKDTGKGINLEEQKLLFVPFYTTKPIGEGTGLGLTIAQHILNEINGTIEVHSTPGKGSQFIVSIPINNATIYMEQEQQQTIVLPKILGRILVIDDEAPIRGIIKRLLKDHIVIEADSGLQGQHILESDQNFDIIICDLMMPAVSGVEIHGWLSSHYPKLAEKIVFITGGAYLSEAQKYLSQLSNLRIEKPFDAITFKLVIEKQLSMSHNQN